MATAKKSLKVWHGISGIRLYTDDAVDALKDLDAFAAQVAAMDLVISTSNSTVHFAGAFGCPGVDSASQR